LLKRGVKPVAGTGAKPSAEKPPGEAEATGVGSWEAEEAPEPPPPLPPRVGTPVARGLGLRVWVCVARGTGREGVYHELDRPMGGARVCGVASCGDVSCTTGERSGHKKYDFIF
jgi:hypothetical protein